MLDELYAMYQQQLDEVKLMRAMLGDGDMPEELLEEVKGEVAKLEAELKQLRAELGDAGHDEAGDAGELAGDELVRSWTHVELTKHAGLQLAQHNRIADNTWYWEEYGDFLWSPAIALARWLAQESIALEDKTVLELGAGLGLPGVTAATVGARQVLIQDQLEVSLREVTATAARNGVDDRVSTLACAWDDLGRQLPVDFREPDVVLGSCLLYEPDTSLALAGSLSQVLKGPGVAYIVAAEWEGSQDVFIDHCKEARLTVERSELHTWVPDAEQEATTMHAMFTVRTTTTTQQ